MVSARSTERTPVFETARPPDEPVLVAVRFGVAASVIRIPVTAETMRSLPAVTTAPAVAYVIEPAVEVRVTSRPAVMSPAQRTKVSLIPRITWVEPCTRRVQISGDNGAGVTRYRARRATRRRDLGVQVEVKAA